MSVTREEATVVLGLDLGTIERNLGIGKSYFDRWGKQLKSDQEKYTEWWGAELKKREEMEVAASVRAATRANLARKLRRERTEASAERISEEIGQGSIPESWGKVSEAAKTSAHEAEGAFTHFKHHAKHEIHGAAEIIANEFGGKAGQIAGGLKGFMFGTVTVIAAVGMEAWNKFTEWVAGRATGAESPLNELTAKLLDAKREYYRKEREEREKAREAEKLANEEARKNAQEQLKLDDQLTDIQIRQREETEGANTAAGRSSEHGRLQLNVANLEYELDIAKAGKDRIEITKKQIELESAKLELIRFETEEQRRQAEAQKIQANAERERQQIAKAELSQFMPTLQELSHRGIFRREARQIGRLERNIRRDFEFGNVSKAQQDLAARDKLYDSLSARGALPEREAARQQTELARRTAESLDELKNGKKALFVKPQLAP